MPQSTVAHEIQHSLRCSPWTTLQSPEKAMFILVFQPYSYNITYIYARSYRREDLQSFHRSVFALRTMYSYVLFDFHQQAAQSYIQWLRWCQRPFFHSFFRFTFVLVVHVRSESLLAMPLLLLTKFHSKESSTFTHVCFASFDAASKLFDRI